MKLTAGVSPVQAKPGPWVVVDRAALDVSSSVVGVPPFIAELMICHVEPESWIVVGEAPLAVASRATNPPPVLTLTLEYPEVKFPTMYENCIQYPSDPKKMKKTPIS